MFQILVGAILALVGIFVCLALIIVGNKVWRDGRQRLLARRRGRLEPALMRYAAGAISLDEALEDSLPPAHRPLVEEILLDGLQSVGPDSGDRLTRALEHLGFVDERIDALQSESWWKRAAAAEALGRSGSRRSAAPLVEALDDEHAEVRVRAATALAELGGATAMRPLIRILDEPSRWSTIRVAHILERKGDAIVGDLITVFSELGSCGRSAILDILADLGATEAAPWIRERLSDADPDVQARAAHALGTLGAREAGPALLQLLYHREWPVRAMAAKAIGRITFEPAVDGLCVALRDDAWWVRANSAEALCRLGPDGLAGLERMLDDADSFAAQQAVRVLEDAGIVDQQVDRLADSDQLQRNAARLFVEKVIGTGQCDRLRQLAAEHPDGAVRWILALVLPHRQKVEGDAA